MAEFPLPHTPNKVQTFEIQNPGEIGNVKKIEYYDNKTTLTIITGRSGFHVRPSTIFCQILPQVLNSGVQLKFHINGQTLDYFPSSPMEILALRLGGGKAFEIDIYGSLDSMSYAAQVLTSTINNLNIHPVAGSQSVRSAIRELGILP